MQPKKKWTEKKKKKLKDGLSEVECCPSELTIIEMSEQMKWGEMTYDKNIIHNIIIQLY